MTQGSREALRWRLGYLRAALNADLDLEANMYWREIVWIKHTRNVVTGDTRLAFI